LALTDEQVARIVDETLEYGCAWAGAIGGWPDEQQWKDEVEQVATALRERGRDSYATAFLPAGTSYLSTVIVQRAVNGDEYDWYELVLPALRRESGALREAIDADGAAKRSA
jgi:hypothetical protein